MTGTTTELAVRRVIDLISEYPRRNLPDGIRPNDDLYGDAGVDPLELFECWSLLVCEFGARPDEAAYASSRTAKQWAEQLTRATPSMGLLP
ncbi:hypothetical protein ACIBHY_04925 [Nonomuraea sp. NPDC050547]|uniref:hypothetical protein n=1 Tax=unclassified Nonomuraea TaxID=2593643 RepID=UPI0037A8BFB8